MKAHDALSPKDKTTNIQHHSQIAMANVKNQIKRNYQINLTTTPGLHDYS